MEPECVKFDYFCFQAIYKKVMPLYFPRNKQEEDFVLNELPGDIGGLMFFVCCTVTGESKVSCPI